MGKSVVRNLNEIKRPFEGMSVVVLNELATYEFIDDRWSRKKRTETIKPVINKVSTILQ